MKDAAKDPGNMDDLANYSFSELLRDGRSVVIRAIRPDDRGLFHDALGKISPQSLYFRLFSGKRSFSDEELKPFFSVDFINTVALLAVLNKEGAEEIVGGGRYIRMDTPRPRPECGGGVPRRGCIPGPRHRVAHFQAPGGDRPRVGNHALRGRSPPFQREYAEALLPERPAHYQGRDERLRPLKDPVEPGPGGLAGGGRGLTLRITRI